MFTEYLVYSVGSWGKHVTTVGKKESASPSPEDSSESCMSGSHSGGGRCFCTLRKSSRSSGLVASGRDCSFPQPWSLLPSTPCSSAQAQRRLRGPCPRLGPAHCAFVPELAMGPGLASPGPLHLQETELQLGVQITGGSS